MSELEQRELETLREWKRQAIAVVEGGEWYGGAKPGDFQGHPVADRIADLKAKIDEAWFVANTRGASLLDTLKENKTLKENLAISESLRKAERDRAESLRTKLAEIEAQRVEKSNENFLLRAELATLRKP